MHRRNRENHKDNRGPRDQVPSRRIGRGYILLIHLPHPRLHSAPVQKAIRDDGEIKIDAHELQSLLEGRKSKSSLGIILR